MGKLLDSYLDYKKDNNKNEGLFYETEELFSDRKKTESIFDTSRTDKKSLLQKYLEYDTKVKEKGEDSSFLEVTSDVLQDIALQPIGGVVDAGESLANLVLPKENELEISDYIPEAKTTFGRFVRPASQFLIPYTGCLLYTSPSPRD